LSLSNYTMLRSTGDDTLHGDPGLSLPPVPARLHLCEQECWHRRNGDLIGKRIGVPEYSMTEAGVGT